VHAIEGIANHQASIKVHILGIGVPVEQFVIDQSALQAIQIIGKSFARAKLKS